MKGIEHKPCQFSQLWSFLPNMCIQASLPLSA